MSRIIAVANQKGGVAKTTTVHALAAGLANLGSSVLAVDLDPQASLSFAMGVTEEPEPSMHDVMLGRTEMTDILYESRGVDLAPSSIDLAGAEVHLLTKTGREFMLQRAIRPLEANYDYILVDCPPSLGILTINALTAASQVIIPVQAETLSHRGVAQLIDTVNDVRQYTNPHLDILGVIVTMFDSRTRLGREVLSDLTDLHDVEVLQPPIPKSVKVAEAPGRGRSILDHAKTSKPADAYREIVQRVAKG
jgi:chromosome partitioning protein